jgi:hypothetical protein
MRRFLAPIIALGGLLLGAQSSLAVQSTFATASGSGTIAQQSTAFTYTTGAGGGLSITPARTFLVSGPGAIDPLDNGATISFTGLNNVGTVVTGPTDTQALSGGTFTILGSAAQVLLTGSFTGATLSTATPLPQSQASFLTTVLGVTYSGGAYFTASGLTNPGGFSFGLTSATPPVNLSGGFFTSFTAGGTGSFSAETPAPPVPEPATVALGFTALPALGIWFWKRRNTVVGI